MNDDTAFLPFTPNFSSTHSVTINKPLEEVFQKFGTADAHADVCALSGLCSAIVLGDKDFVALPPGKTIQESSFLWNPVTPDSGTSTVAQRQHFVLEEAVPTLFEFLNLKVKIRVCGTLTWIDPSPEAFAAGGPVFSVYESEVTNALTVKIYRLRRMEEVVTEEGQKVTKLTEYLHGVGPWYLKSMVAKEAVSGHR